MNVAELILSGIPLEAMLEELHGFHGEPEMQEGVESWGARHLGLGGASLADWCRRACWGIMAGEAVRYHLTRESLHTSVLDLIEPHDWLEMDREREKGGVILVAAHLGPPKTAMHCLAKRRIPLLVWTHDVGSRHARICRNLGVKFTDPTVPGSGSEILVRSALHLRSGGVLFGAPDIASGAVTIALERLGREWRFSPGVPELVRRLGLPAFLVLALWNGNRIQIRSERIDPPDDHLDPEDWRRKWIETYWDLMEPTIVSSPENLRFLQYLKGKALRGLEPT